MPLISKIQIPGNSTPYNLKDSRAAHGIKTVNSTSLEGSGNVEIPDDQMIWFGTCDTASGTASKTITLADSTDTFSLAQGHILRILFSNGNTTSNQVKFSCTGVFTDINAYSRNTSGTLTNLYARWQSGEVIDFIYDGTEFVMVDSNIATTTYYGLVQLSNSRTNTSTTLGMGISAFDTLVTNALNKEDIGTPYYSEPDDPEEFILADSNVKISLEVFGHVASLHGSIRNATSMTIGNSQYSLYSDMNVPIRYAPNQEINVIVPGSTYYVWLLTVMPEGTMESGQIKISRYRCTNSYPNINANQWLTFHTSWVFE